MRLPPERARRILHVSRFCLGISALGAGGSLLLSRAASASCFCLKASYSGVPGRGGKSFGGPPGQDAH
jgi:hypothetical protein